jgi:hypothetical protein
MDLSASDMDQYHKQKATTVTPALETLVFQWSKWSQKPSAKMHDSKDSCLKLPVDSIYSTAEKKSKAKAVDMITVLPRYWNA